MSQRKNASTDSKNPEITVSELEQHQKYLDDYVTIKKKCDPAKQYEIKRFNASTTKKTSLRMKWLSQREQRNEIKRKMDARERESKQWGFDVTKSYLGVSPAVNPVQTDLVLFSQYVSKSGHSLLLLSGRP